MKLKKRQRDGFEIAHQFCVSYTRTAAQHCLAPLAISAITSTKTQLSNKLN